MSRLHCRGWRIHHDGCKRLGKGRPFWRGLGARAGFFGWCPKSGLAQANGLGGEAVFSESSPEGATYGLRSYHAPSGLEAEMKCPFIPSTQAVGLGFVRPPLRGCGLQAGTSAFYEELVIITEISVKLRN